MQTNHVHSFSSLNVPAKHGTIPLTRKRNVFDFKKKANKMGLNTVATELDELTEVTPFLPPRYAREQYTYEVRCVWG